MNGLDSLQRHDRIANAVNLVLREQYSDGSRYETRHAIQIAQLEMLIVIADALDQLLERLDEAEQEQAPN